GCDGDADSLNKTAYDRCYKCYNRGHDTGDRSDNYRDGHHRNPQAEESETMSFSEFPATSKALNEVLVFNSDEDSPECQRHEQEDTRDDQQDEADADGDTEDNPSDDGIEHCPAYSPGEEFTGQAFGLVTHEYSNRANVHYNALNADDE